MIVPGIVIDCDEHKVTVKCSKRDACGSCMHSGKCGGGSFIKLLSPKNGETLVLPNKESIDLKKSQLVALELSDQYILISSFAVYFIPVLLSVVAALCTDAMMHNDIISLIVFFVGMLFFIWIMRFLCSKNVSDYIKIKKLEC